MVRDAWCVKTDPPLFTHHGSRITFRLTKGVQTVANLLEELSKMSPQVDTSDITAVEGEVQSAYRFMFPKAGDEAVAKVFGWAQDCFEGNYPGYLPIDARYHDLEHTLQGTLCMVCILRGRQEADAQPLCSSRVFELGLLAILLHDTGYLKRKHDTQGTGAKYTLTHVHRSMDFAAQLLRDYPTQTEILDLGQYTYDGRVLLETSLLLNAPGNRPKPSCVAPRIRPSTLAICIGAAGFGQFHGTSILLAFCRRTAEYGANQRVPLRSRSLSSI